MRVMLDANLPVDFGKLLTGHLRGEFGPLPREFKLTREHSDLSRRRLGTSGRGSFTELLELVAEHADVKLVLS